MSGPFPLIQYPSPFAQAADVLRGLRQQARDEESQRLQQQALSQQIVASKSQVALGQDEFRLREQQSIDQRKAGELAEQDRRARLALDTATTEARLRQSAIEVRQAEMQIKDRVRQAILDAAIPHVLQNRIAVPTGVLTREQTQNKVLPGAPTPQTPTLAQEVQQAIGRGRVGVEGSAIRAPQAGVSDAGVTFAPETVNYNQPSGNGRGSVTDAEVRSALQTSFQLMDQMEDAVSQDEGANTEPLDAAMAEGLNNFGFTRAIGLGKAGHLFAQGRRSDQQNRFRVANQLLPHIYAQFQAHTRNGPQYAAMIADAMGQMSSAVDPAIRREKMQIVREILNRTWAEINGTPPPPPGSMLLLQDRLPGAEGMPGSGTASPPAINPRFARPQP